MPTSPSVTLLAQTQSGRHSFSLVGKLLLAVFFVVLFEGAVRKWVSPASTIPLLALRDLLVLVGIVYGLSYRLYRLYQWPEILVFCWTILVLAWTLVQIIAQIQPPIVGVIGVRNWILYLWFSLLCYRALTYQDIETIFRVFLYTLIPMVALAVYQHFMPVGHAINVQASGEEDDVFTVAAGVVRTTGTFSFTLGYTQYLAFMTPLVMWLAAGGFSALSSTVFRNTLILSYFIGVAVSGSRGAILFAAIMLVALLTAMLLKGGSGLRRALFILILAVPVGAVVGLYFESAIEANVSRFEAASKVEDTGSRILSTAFGSRELWENFSVIGHGIGAGSNAARSFIGGGEDGFLLGENETARIINEGGGVGLAFYLGKIALALLGVYYSMVAILRNGEVLPFLLWSYLAVQLLAVQLTGQITAHAFTFMGLGIGFFLLKMKITEKI